MPPPPQARAHCAKRGLYARRRRWGAARCDDGRAVTWIGWRLRRCLHPRNSIELCGEARALAPLTFLVGPLFSAIFLIAFDQPTFPSLSALVVCVLVPSLLAKYDGQHIRPR